MKFLLIPSVKVARNWSLTGSKKAFPPLIIIFCIRKFSSSGPALHLLISLNIRNDSDHDFNVGILGNILYDT
jgi:hypothetical protein